LLCDPQPGQSWWDACAGEGGKTLHLADLMQGRGLVWASDRAGWRLRVLRGRAARAKVFNYRSILWSAGEPLPVVGKMDGVLLDAPCSGLGTWQRNPHARWTTQPRDVAELGVRQFELLSAVASAVKPGGKLIYSVCTLTRSETTAVTIRFQEQFPQFRPLPWRNPLPRGTDRAGPVWLWPQASGGNGMFVAGWRREGG